jgi:hypothetical protein
MQWKFREMASFLLNALLIKEDKRALSSRDSPLMSTEFYIQARREWDERYGDLVLGKRNWQIASAGLMLVSLILALGIVWMSARTKVIPIRSRGGQAGRPRLNGAYDRHGFGNREATANLHRKPVRGPVVSRHCLN